MSSSPVSSTPILRSTLIWSGIVAAVLAAVAAGIGYAVAGSNGMWSGLVGVLAAVAFLAITAGSILFANRWFGDPIYVQLFFAIVLGGWLLKLGIFVVVMLVLRGQPWIEPMVFFFSLIAGVLMSLIIDVIVMLRMRIPNVSDIELPTRNPEDDAEEGGQNPFGTPKQGDGI